MRPVLLFALLRCGLVFADSPKNFGPAERQKLLAAAIRALRATSWQQLRSDEERIGELAQGACASGVGRLTIECLVRAARAACTSRGQSCQLSSDVIIANTLGEDRLLEEGEVMSKARRAVELQRARSALAVDFALHTGAGGADGELGTKIDRYCTNGPFDWQTCSSNLVWFIATTGRSVRE